MTSLRDRCKTMIDRMSQNQILRQGNAVEDLMAFVLAERGRSADESLKDTMPLVVYFGTEEDREEFRRLMLEAKPGMIAKRMP